MISRQFLRTDPTIAASFLTGCGGKGVSAVVDPVGDVEMYRRAGNPVSTIGFERKYNRVFAIEDRERFIQQMLRDIPEPPPSAAHTRATNLGAPAHVI